MIQRWRSSLAVSLMCATLWACGQPDDNPTQSNSATSGTGGYPTVAATGGQSGANADPDIRLLSATRSDGELKLVVESSEPLKNIWDPACGSAPRVLKQTAEGWVALQDDRPSEGSTQSYYLDGAFVENCSLGCDGGNSCYDAPLHWELTMSTKEYIQIDTQAAASTDSVCLGREGSLPILISRDAEGPLQLEMRYMSACVSEVRSVRLDLPVD